MDSPIDFVGGTRQKLITLITVSVLAIGQTAIAAKKDFEIDNLRKDYPEWFLKSDLLDLSDTVAEARKNGKKGIFVVVGTEGCSYCYKFYDSSLHDPVIGKLLRENFAAVGFEMFDDNEIVSPKGETIAIKDFVKREGANFTPTIMFYDTEGNQVFKKSGYQSPERFRKIMDFISNGIYLDMSFTSYLKHIDKPQPTKSLPLTDNPHFQAPPYELDRSSTPAKRPLVVLFEKTDCQDCVDFHKDTLALDEVNNALRQFDVVRLDVTDDKTNLVTPSGEKLTPAKWYQSQDFNQVPALMFINPGGHTSLKTDALVRRSRMMNSLNYMLDKAYEKGWTYQRFARSQSIKRNMENKPGTQ